MIIYSNITNFNKDVLESDKLVIADFFATWCGPCQMLGPVLEDIANSDSSIDIIKIDIDANRELALKYEIEAVPTLIFFKDGKELNRIMGFLDKNKLTHFINQYKE